MCTIAMSKEWIIWKEVKALIIIDGNWIYTQAENGIFTRSTQYFKRLNTKHVCHYQCLRIFYYALRKINTVLSNWFCSFPSHVLTSILGPNRSQNHYVGEPGLAISPRTLCSPTRSTNSRIRLGHGRLNPKPCGNQKSETLRVKPSYTQLDQGRACNRVAGATFGDSGHTIFHSRTYEIASGIAADPI